MIDTLVALAILAFLLAVSIPNLNAFKTMQELRTTTRNLVGDLRLTQQRADATASTFELVFSGTPPTSYVVRRSGGSTEKTVSISSNITITHTFSSSTVSIGPNGRPTSGTSTTTCTVSGDSTTYFGCICIKDSSNNVMTILITSTTGWIKTYSGQPATGCS